MNALLVDDSRTIRTMIRSMLTELGFDVVEATHGIDALDKVRSGAHFDVALVDWNMPEMDGLELVRTLRSERRFAGLPVMMVTTEADAHSVVRALMAGADEYAMKPLDAQGLHDKLALLGVLPEGR